MIRSMEATGKTVEEARAAACLALGVNAEDLNVSYEILEMPQKAGLFGGLFGARSTPAKVRVTVEEPDAPAAAPVQAEQPAAAAEPEKVPAPQVKASPQEAQAPAKEPEKTEQPAADAAVAGKPAQTAPVQAAEAVDEEAEVPIVIEENPKVKAAVEYLREVIAHMGVQNVEFSAIQKGEATIIRLDGEKLGTLIGRRGETMESLSYLASLVANRMEGDYMKLGLDVAGYRGKREQDLTALAQRIGAKVRKTGRSFAMEPMNPYERRIIHSAIGKMEGVRSESKGEGRDRRVVIYSTAPDAQTENPYSERRGRSGYRGGNGGGRSKDRSSRGREHGESENRGRGYRGGRGVSNNRGGYHGGRGDRGPRPSSVPERSYVTRDADSAEPVAPKRTERVDDFADFSFGKIDL